VGLVDGAHEHHVRLVTSDQIRPEPSGGSFHLERTYPARAPRCQPTPARWGPPFISSHEFVHICRCHPPHRFRTVGGPAVEIQPVSRGGKGMSAVLEAPSVQVAARAIELTKVFGEGPA